MRRITHHKLGIALLVAGAALAETTVPKGATEIQPGVHRHTDSTGKTYIYRKTPFGIQKSLEAPEKAHDEKPAAAQKESTATPFGPVKATNQQNLLKVTERGEVLEFERPSPFGSYKWKKNKNDLTATERQAWEQSRQTNPSGSKE